MTSVWLLYGGLPFKICNQCKEKTTSNFAETQFNQGPQAEIEGKAAIFNSQS